MGYDLSKPTPLAAKIGKGLGVVAAIGIGIFGINYVRENTNWLQAPAEVQSAVPTGLAPVTGTVAQNGSTIPVVLNSSKEVVTDGSPFRMEVLAWNAEMGLHFANGGPTTTIGSLMAKENLKATILRQDDYGKMQENMLKFATQISQGVANPSEGTAFTIIMGDGYPAFASALSPQMEKLGQAIEVVGAIGYSYGEDKCMVDKKHIGSPQAAKGALIAAVMRDGDYNICAAWAAQNGIAINPDEKTYDPDALNFSAVSSFTDADQKFISGAQEEREVVSKGKKTGKTLTVTVDGTATWTPGDVNVAQNRGNAGILASTREYSYQMPAIIIGNRDYMKKNPEVVKGLLRAALNGSDMVRSSAAALNQAGAISADIYGEQDPAYWVKYAKGVTEPDKQGAMIALGGSRVINLGDNAYLFGLNGKANLFKRTYTMFGDHNKKYYPALFSSYPEYSKVVNTQYLEELLRSSPESKVSAVDSYAGNTTGQVVANGDFQIEFDTGSASFKPGSLAVLEQVLNQTAITNLSVEVRGHTDNVGDSAANMELSKRRAEAVKAYFMQNAGSAFPENRIVTRGYGDSSPAADNASDDGRRKNRRVQIFLRKVG
jgi:OmpA-OmpF porin, OOP family